MAVSLVILLYVLLSLKLYDVHIRLRNMQQRHGLDHRWLRPGGAQAQKADNTAPMLGERPIVRLACGTHWNTMNSLYWESIFTRPCRARQFLDISSGPPVT